MLDKIIKLIPIFVKELSADLRMKEKDNIISELQEQLIEDFTRGKANKIITKSLKDLELDCEETQRVKIIYFSDTIFNLLSNILFSDKWAEIFPPFSGATKEALKNFSVGLGNGLCEFYGIQPQEAKQETGYFTEGTSILLDRLPEELGIEPAAFDNGIYLGCFKEKYFEPVEQQLDYFEEELRSDDSSWRGRGVVSLQEIENSRSHRDGQSPIPESSLEAPSGDIKEGNPRVVRKSFSRYTLYPTNYPTSSKSKNPDPHLKRATPYPKRR